MAFKVIQTTKINTQEFTFLEPDNVNYPVSPAASTKYYTPIGGSLTLKVRATLYINSEESIAPTIKSVKEKDGVLKIKFNSNLTKKTPETCDVWYVELDYTSETVADITKVITYLIDNSREDGENDDPPVSRGTRTDSQD
ncbi:hypothetical protein [Flavobacterium sp. WC2509]|uniref:hypothetical protein n=1 Tax=Flavobacterium sp. WC2509 TaxID=3461406 RepID=UPI004044C5E9